MRESKARGEEEEEGDGKRRSGEGGSNRRAETGRNGWGEEEGLEVGAEREMKRVLSRTAKVFTMRKSLKVKTDKTMT